MNYCQHKVTDQPTRKNIFFCLTLKDYFCGCPTKCPYFKTGHPQLFYELFNVNYDLECTFFHQLVKNSSDDHQLFICEITNQQPDCTNCPLKSSSSLNMGNELH